MIRQGFFVVIRQKTLVKLLEKGWRVKNARQHCPVYFLNSFGK